MNNIAGRNVPNDGRMKAETLLKSEADAPLPEGSGNGVRAVPEHAWRFRFGSFTLDLQRGCLLCGDAEVPLRPKTFAVLRYLAANSGRLVLKDELLAAAWPSVVVTDDSIVQCVTELRRALQDHDHRLIKTVQRRGYRFDAAIRLDPAPAAEPASSAPGAVDRAAAAGPAGRVATARGRGRFVMLGAALLAVAVFAVAWWWLGSRNSTATAQPYSIVVLPFANLGGDREDEFLAEGVGNDLTTDLSRLPGIVVIANATARTFKGTGLDARQVGRELNVRYVLEGSVRRAGEQVRINVELIDAATNASVWAERFERRRDQIATWQDEIIGRIAIALSYRLTRLESERSLRERRNNPEAADLTTRGWSLVYAAKKPENYRAARALFRQALARDPRAVNALAGIGWTSAIMVLDGWSADPPADLKAAESAVAKALDIDANHVVAHHVRGFLFRMQRRSNAARDAFRTVIALNPNFAPGHAQLGATELELGHPDAAIRAVQHAIRLSPRDPSLGPWLAFVGMAEVHRGRYREAVPWLRRAIDTGTPVARHQAYLASALALAGRMPQARAALASFRSARPAATIASLRAQAKSTDAGFIAQQERFFEGLRLAGLPD